MNLQDFVHMPLVGDDKHSSPQFDRFMGEFSKKLQGALTSEGYILPTLTSDQIALLDPAKSINAMLINLDTNELIVNLGGTFKTVQTV